MADLEYSEFKEISSALDQVGVLRMTLNLLFKSGIPHGKETKTATFAYDTVIIASARVFEVHRIIRKP